MSCYYCASHDHEDTPCPQRRADAERFQIQGRTMYPPEPEWWVVSTAIADRCILLACRHTGKTGTVRDPSDSEWSAAYYAPSNPYRWADASRVIPDIRPRK